MSPPMNFDFIGYRQIGRDLATGKVAVTGEAMSEVGRSCRLENGTNTSQSTAPHKSRCGRHQGQQA